MTKAAGQNERPARNFPAIIFLRLTGVRRSDANVALFPPPPGSPGRRLDRSHHVGNAEPDGLTRLSDTICLSLNRILASLIGWPPRSVAGKHLVTGRLQPPHPGWES